MLWSCLVALSLSRLASADVVILNPAEMKAQVSFGPLSLKKFTLEATSTTGHTASKPFTTSPYSLTVESGHSYRSTLEAEFSNSIGARTTLKLERSVHTLVDNQAGPSTVDFTYPTAGKVDTTITVTGGTVAQYEINAFTYTSTEQYSGKVSHFLPTSGPSTASAWIPIIPSNRVFVSGVVYLRTSSGALEQRPLT
ncbi:hypothetical protein NVS55_28700 [Myxococcus stipitatus]|uniref:hypothetical protein n=1 Tax=Myxococcus stipitatus TaxID=83455 RepID=UPI00314525DD